MKTNTVFVSTHNPFYVNVMQYTYYSQLISLEKWRSVLEQKCVDCFNSMELKIFTFISDNLSVTEMTLKEKGGCLFCCLFFFFFWCCYCFNTYIPAFHFLFLHLENSKRNKGKALPPATVIRNVPECLSNFSTNITVKCSRHYCARYFDVSLEGRINPILQLGAPEQFLYYMMGPAMLVTIPLVLQEMLPYPKQLLLKNMKRC